VELAQFLREKVSTYEQLDALLLLARAPLKSWSALAVSEALRQSADASETALEELVAAGGLVDIETVKPKVYQYAPGSELLRRLVDSLQNAYVEQRMEVVQVMTANAIDRARGVAARRLADAFRFERPKK
jgi:hypothetical protein